MGHSSCQSQYSMLVTLLHVSNNPKCQLHYSMLVTLLYVIQTPPLSMLVTLLHVSHTPQCHSHFSICQSHFSMLVTLLYVSQTPQCQSHFSMLVTLLNVSHTSFVTCSLHRPRHQHQNEGRGAPRSSSNYKMLMFSSFIKSFKSISECKFCKLMYFCPCCTVFCILQLLPCRIYTAHTVL